MRPTISIYADCASLDQMVELAKNPLVRGFTTNPTLMRKAGVRDYMEFASSAVALLHGYPLSLEVFADEFPEMERQARILHALGENVWVKIPITNTQGESSLPLVDSLARDGVRVNVTAITTVEQALSAGMVAGARGIVSVFAGRIADTGVDPIGTIERISRRIRVPGPMILWASAREALNVWQAESSGCHVITLSPDLIARLDGFDRDLAAVSLDTVRQFHRDAVAAGYSL